MATAELTADARVRTQLELLQDLTRGQPRDFSVRFWDGSTWDSNSGGPALFTLVLNHAGALRRMLWPPNDLNVAEAYVYDDLPDDLRIDVVVDPVGGPLFEQAVGRLRPLGTLVAIGAAGGRWETMNPALLVGRARRWIHRRLPRRDRECRRDH